MKLKKLAYDIEHNSFGDQIIHWLNVPSYTYGGITVNHEGFWEEVQKGEIYLNGKKVS